MNKLLRDFLAVALKAGLVIVFILFASFMITTCGIAGWFAAGATLLAIIEIVNGGNW